MNLIEINWFKKYEQKNWSKKYKKALTKIQINLGKQNLPSAKNIGQYACSVMELDVPPRGQILKYDGGYDLLQK
jgi:hypothetical protein